MKTIVWDLDDVLNSLMESWLEKAFRLEHPENTVAFAELRSNPPLLELNLGQEEYLRSLDRFRNSREGREMPPHPIILDWFQQFGHRFNHHVLTARPHSTVATASAWVFEHLGTWFRHFHFVPSSRQGVALPVYEATKGEVLRGIGRVDYFIDDSPDNVADAQALGICAFLFPQPWNAGTESVDRFLEDLRLAQST